MNLRDGNPADSQRAKQEAESQYAETMSNWEYIRRLQAESKQHAWRNHFAERIREALEL